MKEIDIWHPIGFTEEWNACDTSKLDNIAPSWIQMRQRISLDSSEYFEFMEQIKRQHAIETGIIERLYDLKEGVTETFIKDGFVECSKELSKNTPTIPPPKRLNWHCINTAHLNRLKAKWII